MRFHKLLEAMADNTEPLNNTGETARLLIIAVLIVIAAFLGGGLAGYELATTSLNFGANNAVVEIIEVQPPPIQVPAQPTQPPAVIDDVNIEGDPFVGPEDAPITIVEFSDFRCGFCRRFHDETYETLMEQYDGQIRFVYRDLPIVGGQTAAEAAECANEQDAFWAYHDSLFAEPTAYSSPESFVELASQLGLDESKFGECLADGKYRDEITEDAQDAQAYGVSGTPTFFINGVRVVGAQPLSAFTTIIDEELGQ